MTEALSQLKELFGKTWKEEDLQAVLNECQGDAEMAWTRIIDGHATQWEDSSKPKPKNPLPSDGKKSHHSSNHAYKENRQPLNGESQTRHKNDRSSRTPMESRGARRGRGGMQTGPRRNTEGGKYDKNKLQNADSNATAVKPENNTSLPPKPKAPSWPNKNAGNDVEETEVISEQAPAPPAEVPIKSIAEDPPAWNSFAGTTNWEGIDKNTDIAPAPSTRSIQPGTSWANIVKPVIAPTVAASPPPKEASPARPAYSPHAKSATREPSPARQHIIAASPSPRMNQSEIASNSPQSITISQTQAAEILNLIRPQSPVRLSRSEMVQTDHHRTASPSPTREIPVSGPPGLTRQSNTLSNAPPMSRQTKQNEPVVLPVPNNNVATLGVQFGSLSFGIEDSQYRQNQSASQAQPTGSYYKTEQYQQTDTPTPNQNGYSDFTPQTSSLGGFPMNSLTDYGGMYGGDPSRGMHGYYDQGYSTTSARDSTKAHVSDSLSSSSGAAQPAPSAPSVTQNQTPGQGQPQAPSQYPPGMNQMYAPYFPYYVPNPYQGSGYAQPFMNSKHNMYPVYPQQQQQHQHMNKSTYPYNYNAGGAQGSNYPSRTQPYEEVNTNEYAKPSTFPQSAFNQSGNKSAQSVASAVDYKSPQSVTTPYYMNQQQQQQQGFSNFNPRQVPYNQSPGPRTQQQYWHN